MTLIIVENSSIIVTRTKELLEEVMCINTIKSCGTYADAVQLLDQHSPNLALLEINLPDKSGIELLKYIKAFFPKTIVIMVANQHNILYANHSIQLGAHHYIDKSKEFDKLAELVRHYCS